MLLSDQIRDAITKCGLSVYQVAMAVKVEEKSMRRFLRGDSGLSLTAVDRVAERLGLSIKVDQVQ